MAYRATPNEFFFTPDSGGSPEPIVRREVIRETASTSTTSTIDPNLLLFGFGVLGLIGLFALLAYFSSRK